MEGQLKSQLKSGSVRNAGLMRPMGERVGEDSNLEQRKDILRVYLVVISMPRRAHVLYCSLLQETAAKRSPISV